MHASGLKYVTNVLAYVYGRSLAGIAGSNSVGGMDVCLLWVLCVVTWASLRRADLSYRGVLLSVVCLSVTQEPHGGSLGLSNYKKFHMI